MMKFLLLFKLEYLKFINSCINTNKTTALQPEKNTALAQEFIDAKNKSKTATETKEAPPKEEQKQPEKESTKPREKESIMSKQSEAGSEPEAVSSKPDLQRTDTTEYHVAEKPSKRTKFDVKGCFAKIKYPIPALVNLSNNVNLLPSISIHLPMDRGSNMLDLLNWSMQIGYIE